MCFVNPNRIYIVQTKFMYGNGFCGMGNRDFRGRMLGWDVHAFLCIVSKLFWKLSVLQSHCTCQLYRVSFRDVVVSILVHFGGTRALVVP